VEGFSDSLTAFFQERKRRTPTGTFLSNRMRNAVALGVSEDGFDAPDRQLELFGDLRGA